MTDKAAQTTPAATLGDNNDRQTVTLDEPIIRGSHSIDEIQIRTPKAGELRGLSLSNLLQLDVDTLKVLLPRITAPAITELEVDNLAPADLVQLSTKVISFLVPAEKQESLIA
ncbi:MAG: phage tail assembly protein [Oceanospirillaceae bacterium]|nr:phage tail assembly protein [Oceanospirillaceae bacterium]